MPEKTDRYFLQIAYLGTRYHGWQIQQNATTVQGVIQTCLAQVLRRPVQIVGSSRTDTGVHARQQCAHVDLPHATDIAHLRYQLNAVLPPDIAVEEIHPVHANAHARFDASFRTYEYTIAQNKSPFQLGRSCLLYKELDASKMNEAAAILCQKKDFQSLCRARPGDAHFVCTMMEAGWVAQGNTLLFRIKANRFLRSMVRIIVSLLLKIGRHQLSLADFEAIIDKKERNTAIILVPARGLSLTQVAYPTTLFLANS